MEDYFDSVDLGKINPVRVESEPGLRVSYRMIPALSFKSWEAWILSGFTTPPKGFEGKVNSELGILKNLRKNFIKFWFCCFPFSEFYLAGIKRDRFFLRLPNIFSKCKSFVIDPTSLFQNVIHFGCLKFSWV